MNLCSTARKGLPILFKFGTNIFSVISVQIRRPKESNNIYLILGGFPKTSQGFCASTTLLIPFLPLRYNRASFTKILNPLLIFQLFWFNISLKNGFLGKKQYLSYYADFMSDLLDIALIYDYKFLKYGMTVEQVSVTKLTRALYKCK